VKKIENYMQKKEEKKISTCAFNFLKNEIFKLKKGFFDRNILQNNANKLIITNLKPKEFLK
jgi:hypothetical protein